jgi:hypothetical protein
MKALRYPCMLLMAYAFTYSLNSCKKIPPQYACSTPVKTVTVYDTTSSIVNFERRYTYDQQGRVDSIIDLENNGHSTGTLTYIMSYDTQNQLTNVRLLGLANAYDIQYRSSNGLISGIASALFVASGYAYTFGRNEQWYTGATVGLLISNASSKLKEIAYFTNTLHPTDPDSIITSARSSGAPEESKYYYTYSNQLNPEYTAYNNGWFYAYSINQHYALQYDPAASSQHLPSFSHNWLLHQSPSGVTSYSFTKDRCGRVTKVYAIQNGVQKLWKIYTYY